MCNINTPSIELTSIEGILLVIFRLYQTKFIDIFPPLKYPTNEICPLNQPTYSITGGLDHVGLRLSTTVSLFMK